MNTQPHKLEWVAPAPLWPSGPVDSVTMRRPALLEFKSNQFVTELTQALAQTPPTLPVAQWESARVPPAGTPRLGSPPYSPSQGSPPLPLKLFQPVHGRFYMVAASFVCQQIGLPDHALKVANQERTFFVLRKLDPQGREMAWVPNPAYPSDPTQFAWQLVTQHPRRPQLAPNEELIPLFPVFVPGSTPARRLHAGLIPTSSRDTLAAAPTTSAPSSPPAGGVDPRVLEASTRVVDPYGAIANASIGSPPPSPDPAMALLIDASAFLMLDLAEILQKYVPDVYAAIMNPAAAAPTGAPQTQLYTQLVAAVADTTTGVTWAAALRAASAAQSTIDAPGSPASQLTTPAFNLYYSDRSTAQAILPDPAPGASAPATGYLLSALLAAAIVDENQPFDPPDAVAATQVVPKLDAGALYVVRCVFQRCALKREQFAALYPSILSDRSQRFMIAPFFDSDAPARQIRIAMPFDTSPAALRKFPKGIGFLMSPQFLQQVNQASNLKNVVNGQVGPAGALGMGEICCFSFQILVIISFILMFMIAIALNFVFWWLPFLKICLPVPSGVVSAASGSDSDEA